MNGQKILLVEDDQLIRNLYERALSNGGLSAKAAVNGAEATNLAKKEDFDLILLDIMLPDKDGFQVLQEIKKEGKNKETPVIILSNLDDDPVLTKALQLGAHSYIIKSSSTPTKIIEEIKSVLA